MRNLPSELKITLQETFLEQRSQTSRKNSVRWSLIKYKNKNVLKK